MVTELHYLVLDQLRAVLFFSTIRVSFPACIGCAVSSGARFRCALRWPEPLRLHPTGIEDVDHETTDPNGFPLLLL